MKKNGVIFIFLILIMCNIYAQEGAILETSAMKIKQISVNLNIELPINFSEYTSSDEFTYKTAIFQNLQSQEVDVIAYYYDNDGTKIYGDILEENGNKYARFKIRPIKRNQYIFYITGTIVSESNFVLRGVAGDLKDIPEEIIEYTKATKFIQSDQSEIRTVASFLKNSDDPLENLVYITNWVHNFIDYDLSYVSVVNDSLTVLSDRKGVCDEFSILEAAILRAQGYPVKYVVGYANTSQEWGAHAWLEVYIPGHGWIPADPTYNEVGTLDATHIVLEKLSDPRESKDSVTSTNDVVVKFGEKTQEIAYTQIKTFEEDGYGDNIEFSIITSKDTLEGSPHITKLKLENKSNDPIIILVASQLAKDFIQLYPESRKTIYYIKPKSTKTVDYYFKLPKLDGAYIYEFGYLSQYSDITDTINIYQDSGTYQELFFSYDPVIYYRGNQFIFENQIFNYTKKDKNITYDFNYAGAKSEITEIIPKFSEKEFTKTFIKTENTNFSYNILGDYNSFGAIAILPTIETPYVFDVNTDINELTDNDKNNLEVLEKVNNTETIEKTQPNYLMIFLVGAFVVFIIILFISKMFKKE